MPGRSPALAILAKEIDIIGIAYKDKPEDSQKFLADFGNPYSQAGMDNAGRAGLDWGSMVYGNLYHLCRWYRAETPCRAD